MPFGFAPGMFPGVNLAPGFGQAVQALQITAALVAPLFGPRRVTIPTGPVFARKFSTVARRERGERVFARGTDLSRLGRDVNITRSFIPLPGARLVQIPGGQQQAVNIFSREFLAAGGAGLQVTKNLEQPAVFARAVLLAKGSGPRTVRDPHGGN